MVGDPILPFLANRRQILCCPVSVARRSIRSDRSRTAIDTERDELEPGPGDLDRVARTVVLYADCSDYQFVYKQHSADARIYGNLLILIEDTSFDLYQSGRSRMIVF
jgi:hypothetical protein